MPGDELLPPVGYPVWWTVLGVVLVLLAAALLVAPFWFTRRTAAEAQAEPSARARTRAPGADPWAPLRQEYAQRLDELERRFERDELDSRAVHQELAREMRRFAAARLGRPVETLTLDQITQVDGSGRLTRLITRYYLPEFAEPDHPTAFRLRVGTSVDQAREVVREW